MELCSTAFLFYYNKTNPSSVLCKFALATFLVVHFATFLRWLEVGFGILIDVFAKIAGGYGIGPTLLNVYGIQRILNLTCEKWLPPWGSSHVVGERALGHFALSVMLTHATS
ncbi:MAG: hypothetical protein IJY13_02285, partial [Clostridia bacterium]|nr:hypothetical protein [Clostridia bacterium]